MNVGKRITKLRQQRGITTNRLANLAGLSQSFIRSVELGEKGITVDNLALLCDVLQITLAEFFEEHPESPNTVNGELTALLHTLTPAQKSALLQFLKSLRE